MKRCHYAFALVMFISLQTALAGGFQVPTQSARAAGQGDAFTAQADDPSAIHYNPAGLTHLDGTSISAGLHSVIPQFEFTGATDAIGDASNNDPAFIPHLYLSSDLNLETWRFGLGVTTVFGLSEDFGDNSPLRYIVTNADLTVTAITPTLSYALTDNLSLGAGVNLYTGTIEINNRVPLPTGNEGVLTFEGDGLAVGGTLGLLWKINDQHAAGLTYRSPFRINFDGSAQLWRTPSTRLGPEDADAGADFPQIIVLGYAWRPTTSLTLAADLQWADWETLDTVRAKSDDPVFNNLPPRRFDYDSSFTYRVGAQYQLDPTWTLRAGYVFSPTSSPERTFTPAVIDLDTHIFTLGLGYTRSRWSIDLAYRLIYAPDREIDNSINSPRGSYSDLAHAILITATYRL